MCMSIYIGYVYTDDDNPVHHYAYAIYKEYIMNAIISKALWSIAAVNANNALISEGLFEDCGLNFDLLNDQEEAVYDMMMDELVRNGYNEAVRLDTKAVERANAKLALRK